MDTGTVTAIREARQQLRARGEPDSMHRVVALVQCSQSTVRKYWSRTEPEAPSVDTGPSAPAPVPGTVSSPAAPRPTAGRPLRPTCTPQHAFRPSRGLRARPPIRYTAAPAVPARYALPRSDPWYASLRQELHRTYTAFMDARAAWREDPTAAAHLEQVRQELASLRQGLAVADRQLDEATRTMHPLARDPPLARRPTSPPDTQPPPPGPSAAWCRRRQAAGDRESHHPPGSPGDPMVHAP